MSGAVDVRGILERAGANPDAPEGSQAWALEQVHAAVAELIVNMRRIKAAAALGIRYHAIGPGYTEEIMRIADASLARITGAKS